MALLKRANECEAHLVGTWIWWSIATVTKEDKKATNTALKLSCHVTC